MIAILSMENVSYIVKLADRFLCDEIMEKCCAFLAGVLENPKSSPTEKTAVLNLGHKYFKSHKGCTLLEKISTLKMKEIDLDSLDSFDIIRGLLLKYVSGVRSVSDKGYLSGKRYSNDLKTEVFYAHVVEGKLRELCQTLQDL